MSAARDALAVMGTGGKVERMQKEILGPHAPIVDLAADALAGHQWAFVTVSA